MSTTVTYKGNTLTTVNNATRTLKTAGKYMEGDVILTDTDNTLVVTLSYNESTEMWEPDKTFAEIKTAYEAGKTIAAVTNEDPDSVSADGHYVVEEVDESTSERYFYSVRWFDDSSGTDITYEQGYNLNSEGLFPYRLYVWSLGTPISVSPLNVASNGTYTAEEGTAYSPVTVAVPTPAPSLQSKSVSYTPSETAQSATVTADSGYDGLSSVDVSVGAISSTYVGSGIMRRSSTDLTASGATVTVPAGYYASQASKAIASGTEGTPTATKGTVSNHAISITPSVTNSAGYIAGGTKTGTALSVSASELVSGTYTVSASGIHDVTNYASASVAAGGATASATKGTVANHSVTVTPSVTRTAGYITAGTSNGTTVTVSASELVSGSETKTTNGTYDVTNLAQLVVDIDDDSTYRRVEVCPQQTLTPDSDRKALPIGMSELVVGEHYVTTVDGTEYFTTCCLLWETNHVIGDTNCIFTPNGDLTYPFVAVTVTGDKEIYFNDTNQHTIKIERLEFTGDAVILSSKTITANGTYSASNDNADGYASVNVAVSVSELVSGTYTVNASGIHDVTNYESAYVAAGSTTAPSSINGTAALVSTGTNTLTLTKSVSVTPSVTAGYISSGTAGNSSVSLTASVSTKAAATITPSTSNQTIAAGTYLTGAQTIAGDADLIASNIISTANIFGVQGSVVVQNYYTGTSEPSSSLGINGDLYFQTKE